PLSFSSLQHKFKAPHRARAKQTICTLTLLRQTLLLLNWCCDGLAVPALDGALNFCDGEEKGRGPV
ncbi:hypothetical protein, partial [Ralstonia pseudosolanacearum]|uniref:hypothetical protein n=1 Tax=Ralstonia pseudosolanacearum TaxID=1310165 RepID=UPI001FF7252F